MISIKVKLVFGVFDLLETVQRTWWGDARYTCPIHGAELDFRDVKRDGGRLQSGLHDFQRAGQYSTHCAATSGGRVVGGCLGSRGWNKGRNMVRKSI